MGGSKNLNSVQRFLGVKKKEVFRSMDSIQTRTLLLQFSRGCEWDF